VQQRKVTVIYCAHKKLNFAHNNLMSSMSKEPPAPTFTRLHLPAGKCDDVLVVCVVILVTIATQMLAP
jgi:hypothetical protein